MTVTPASIDAFTSEQRTAAFHARMRDRKPPLVKRVWDRLTARLSDLVTGPNTGPFTSRHRGRRLAALAVAIAVPAVAAPDDWSALQFGKPDLEQAAAVQPMPFEQAGQSFPGSAFYYLEQSPRAFAELESRDLALFDMSGTGGADDIAQADLMIADKVGPAARRFSLSGDGLDKARALNCMTNAIYYEAASEADAGQSAVAQVVLNRVAHPAYPNSVCGVVFQGSERRTGCQFSFTCDGSLNRTPAAGAWTRARRIAQRALRGSVFEPVGLATHYHTVWIYPYWAPSLDHIGTIGAHRFYRWKGNAGKPGAFRSRYAGYEPANARKSRGAETPQSTAPADPIALAKAYEEGRLKALNEARMQSIANTRTSGSKPAKPEYIDAMRADTVRTNTGKADTAHGRGGDDLYRAGNLAGSGTVKPEYANSGRWIAQPQR